MKSCAANEVLKGYLYGITGHDFGSPPKRMKRKWGKGWDNGFEFRLQLLGDARWEPANFVLLPFPPLPNDQEDQP